MSIVTAVSAVKSVTANFPTMAFASHWLWLSETKMSSLSRTSQHWRHWGLSFWQLPVQSVIEISPKWQHFRVSVCQWNHDFNTLRPRQNCHHLADDIFKCILLNKNLWILFNISLKFVSEVRINIIPALVQIMAWTDKATSHSLNKWWLDYRRIYASLGLNELIMWRV